MNLQESIRRILREESSIPLALRRRVSYDDIEEAFDHALERMAQSMTNPDSIIYKEKEHTTLRLFAKFVIDEMVTYLEQDYFNDDNRVYFSDDDFYYDKIRKPLLKRYGKRIKEKYNEVKRGDINESILREETQTKPKVFNYKKYTLILSKDPCDIFRHFKVEDLHGLNYKKCLAYKNTKENAYIAGLTNISPKTKKHFLFLNTNRLGNGKEKMGLIMHETMHLSLELHKHDVKRKEEEIITWTEKEAYKIYDIIEKL